MRRLYSKASEAALMCAIGLGFPITAVAQVEAAEATAGEVIEEDEVRSLDLIVVSARGREENIQDVPLAITAFDKEAMTRKSIQELEDVARFTSGFSFEDFSGGFANPVIRGQAQTRTTALESNVSSFWNGVYIPRSWAVDVGTANVERIEVVKGPQSARYGRNAFSGAINYAAKSASISDQPVTADVTGTMGSDDRLDAGIFGNFTFSDKFAIAGSYNISEFDGSWENSHPFANLGVSPGTSGNVGGWDNESYSISAAIEPTDRISIEAGLYNTQISSEARASQYLSPQTGDTNCGELLFGFFDSLICGELPAPGETSVNDPRGYGTQSDTDIITLKSSFELTDSLTATYLYGKIEGDVDIAVSGEPDPINCGTLVGPPAFASLCNFQVTPVGDIDYDSHEIRLDFSAGDQLTGGLGIYFSEGVDNVTFSSVNIAPVTDAVNFVPFVGTPIPSFVFDPGPFNILLGDDTIMTDVSSVFGELQWASSDGMTRAGVEARYSETEITAINNRNDDRFNDTFSVFTPRFTVERDLNSDQLIYGTIARGAKAGGFNTGATNPVNQTFEEELNWTYEIGSKNTLFDGALTLNGAIYYTDWTNMQLNGADPDAPDPANAVSIVTNLGNATVFGFEFDALIRATDNLSFDATFSHADSTYDDGTIDNRFVRGAQCDDVVCGSDGDIGGNEVERTPPTQASVGTQWEADINSDMSYFLRGDLSWQSDFYVSSANIATIPERTLLNLRAGLTYRNIDFSIWGRNVTDEKYVSNAFAVFLPFGNTYGEFFGERATYGATIGVNF